MNSYPHDEFDDVPEDSERRGAYRGYVCDQHTSRAGFVGMLVFGGVALLVGALMFIFQPRTLAPEVALESSSPSASASASATSPQEDKQPEQLVVQVYNGGAYTGAAGEVTEVLTAEGYTVITSANWQGAAVASSMVYYSTENVDEAHALADRLGIAYVGEDRESPVDLYIVLGPDFTGVGSGADQQDAAAEEPQYRQETDGLGEAETGLGTEEYSESNEVVDPYQQVPTQNYPYQEEAELNYPGQSEG